MDSLQGRTTLTITVARPHIDNMNEKKIAILKRNTDEVIIMYIPEHIINNDAGSIEEWLNDRYGACEWMVGDFAISINL